MTHWNGSEQLTLLSSQGETPHDLMTFTILQIQDAFPFPCAVLIFFLQKRLPEQSTNSSRSLGPGQPPCCNSETVCKGCLSYDGGSLTSSGCCFSQNEFSKSCSDVSRPREAGSLDNHSYTRTTRNPSTPVVTYPFATQQGTHAKKNQKETSISYKHQLALYRGDITMPKDRKC